MEKGAYSSFLGAIRLQWSGRAYNISIHESNSLL